MGCEELDGHRDNANTQVGLELWIRIPLDELSNIKREIDEILTGSDHNLFV